MRIFRFITFETIAALVGFVLAVVSLISPRTLLVSLCIVLTVMLALPK